MEKRLIRNKIRTYEAEFSQYKNFKLIEGILGPIVELYHLMENISSIVKKCREVSAMIIGALKILVVDDQEGIRYLLDIIAREAGHEVIMAQNGLEGVELCSAHNPDLIFMDIRMPVLDGIQAVKKIRKFNKNVQIIIMTAYSEKRAIDELKKYGISKVISKPFDVKEVQQLLVSYDKNLNKFITADEFRAITN